MRDPLEFWEYPEEWIRLFVERQNISKATAERLIKSGFYILTPEGGFLKRGITTGTAASAAVKAGILSTAFDFDVVDVETPSGIRVKVEVYASNGVARVKKFSGDHAFDITHGLEFVARVENGEGVVFGKGIGVFRGKKSVSRSAGDQIQRAYAEAAKEAGRYKVVVEAPGGERIYTKTDNVKLGIRGGISILGTTGFVEPWCKELVDVKRRIARRYSRVVLTTGRKGFNFARENFPDYQAFVAGVYIEEFLEVLQEKEIVIVGMPSLLIKWAEPELKPKILRNAEREFLSKKANRVLEKAGKIANVSTVVLIDSHGEVITQVSR